MNDFNTLLSAVSVAFISEILGIVVTSILIIYWIFVLGLKIYQVAKDGKLDKEELEELKDVTEETEKQFDKLSEQIESNESDEVQSTEQGE